MADDSIGVTLWGIVILIVVLCYAVPALYCLPFSSAEYENITVQSKWIKPYDDYSVYLFSDQYGNVYSIQDSKWNWIFNASDRWDYVKENKTYNIKTWGKRSEFWSNYPNAIEIEEVK